MKLTGPTWEGFRLTEDRDGRGKASRIRVTQEGGETRGRCCQRIPGSRKGPWLERTLEQVEPGARTW